jgi:hypothetical protein
VRRALVAISSLAALGVLLPAVGAMGDGGSGARVSGAVSQTETGKPLANVKVCVEAVAPEKGELCDATDAEGNYAITGIPAGTYVVAFGVETGSGGRTVAQWWDGASSPAQATSITMAPPQIFTGLNAQLGTAAAGSKPHNGGGTIVVPGKDQHPPAELIPQRCKKGYRWRKVHGVKRCVPKPHHHHRAL